MDEHQLVGGKDLLELHARRRWKKKKVPPIPRRGGRFIPSHFIHVHDSPEGEWFVIPAMGYGLPGESVA